MTLRLRNAFGIEIPYNFSRVFSRCERRRHRELVPTSTFLPPSLPHTHTHPVVEKYRGIIHDALYCALKFLLNVIFECYYLEKCSTNRYLELYVGLLLLWYRKALEAALNDARSPKRVCNCFLFCHFISASLRRSRRRTRLCNGTVGCKAIVGGLAFFCLNNARASYEENPGFAVLLSVREQIWSRKFQHVANG